MDSHSVVSEPSAVYPLQMRSSKTSQIFRLVTGSPAFGFWSINIFVAAMIECAGEFPPEWQASWAQLELDTSEDFDMSKVKPALF